MIRNLFHTAIVALAAVMLLLAADSAAAQERTPARPAVWEVVQLTDGNTRGDGNRDIADVAVTDGKVTIAVERAVTVRVFSILGQLITQKQLAPGRHRLTLPTKGIYILKAGADTRRISI